MVSIKSYIAVGQLLVVKYCQVCPRHHLNHHYHDDHHLNHHHDHHLYYHYDDCHHHEDDHLHGFTQARAVGQLLVVKYCQAC